MTIYSGERRRRRRTGGRPTTRHRRIVPRTNTQTYRKPRRHLRHRNIIIKFGIDARRATRAVRLITNSIRAHQPLVRCRAAIST